VHGVRRVLDRERDAFGLEDEALAGVQRSPVLKFPRGNGGRVTGAGTG
jgi:hypothetical protein